MENNSRGSEWRKWDLHVHTASSYDYKYKENDADDKLIEALRNNGISAVAITDHFVIDKNRITSLKEKAKEIVFFPGVELRTDKGATNIHVILIFSDKSNLETLCESFNVFKREKGEDSDIDDKVIWEYRDIVDFAKKHDALISIHAGSKSNGVDDRITNALPINQATKEKYAKTIDIFEMGQIRDLEEYRNHVFPDIKQIKPMIICSDNHNPTEYKCSLWIKADTTFEGLKQILYEPEERVRIQELKPEEKAGYQVINSIALNKNDFWNGEIFLNENLNTIIGGRSTGKSTLLKAIAKKIDGSLKFEDNSETFINDCLDGITVKWKDEEQGKNRDIDFFSQGYMYEIARNSQKMNDLIDKIIREKAEYHHIESYQNIVNDIKAAISTNLFELFQIKSEIEKKQTELKEAGDKEGIEKEIKRIDDVIANLNNGAEITQDESEQYKKYQDQISKLENEINTLNGDLQYLEEFKTKSIVDGTYADNFLKLTEQTQNSIKSQFETIKKEIDEKWLKNISDEIAKIRESTETKSKEIDTIKATYVFNKCNEYFLKNTELNQLQENRKLQNDKLQKILTIQKELEELKSHKNDKIKAIIDRHKKFKDEMDSLVKNLRLPHDNVQISATIRFKKEEMQNFLEQQMNIRGNERQTYVEDIYSNYNSNIEEICRNFINRSIDNQIELKSGFEIQKVVTDFLTKNWYDYGFKLNYENDDFEHMSDGKKAFVVLKLLLEFSEKKCPILIDQPEDSLDNRAIYNELVKYIRQKKTERQIILVTHNPNIVVGADAENVIVANQNGSNSPNKNQIKFQYVNGSLEDTKTKDDGNKIVLEAQGIREHICEILEGGKEAFEKREKKYGL